MSGKKYLLFFACLFFLSLHTAQVAAQASSEQDESPYEQRSSNERDFAALRDYLRTKRLENLEEEGENQLVVSGDVRTEWRYMRERSGHKKERGGDAKNRSGLPISNNDFDIEMNIYFDYLTEKEAGPSLIFNLTIVRVLKKAKEAVRR